MKFAAMCGIGDALCVEASWTHEEKKSLTTLYHATIVQDEIREVFDAMYDQEIEHVTLWYENTWNYCGNKSVVPDDALLPSPQMKPYQGSSLNKKTLADIRKFQLPERYVAIQATTRYGSLEHRRNFLPEDWAGMRRALDVWGIPGVLIGSDPSTFQQPDIDLIGQTTILEAIEIVKGATVFCGIDSCMSVVAAKCLKGKFYVRSINPHIEAEFYFMPRFQDLVLTTVMMPDTIPPLG